MRLLRSLTSLVVVLAGLAALPPPASATGTTRARTSVTAQRVVTREGATLLPTAPRGLANRTDTASVSNDGRYVAFASGADPDTNVYVYDRVAGTTERVSVDDGALVGSSGVPSLSPSGRYVAFASLHPWTSGDAGGFDVYVYDRQTRTHRLASRLSTDWEAVAPTYSVQVSNDGRTVAFSNGASIVVRRLGSGGFRREVAGVEGQLSGDGRYYAYRTDPANLVRRIDVATGTDIQVSVTPAGASVQGYDATISYDGSRVAFFDPVAARVGLWDAATGEVIHAPADLGAASALALSGDGRYLSYATLDGSTPVVGRLDWASGSHALVDGPLTPSPRELGRPPWTAEISGDGLVQVMTSDSTLPGQASTVATRRWAVTGATVGGSTLESWVKSVYQSILGRAPTAAESQQALADLGSLRLTTAQLVQQVLRTPSFATPRAPMIRLYQAFFLRAPDTSGLDYWVGRRLAGQSLNRIAEQFAASQEFRTRYGSLTDRQFVELVYQNVLGRAGEPTGVDFWTLELKEGRRKRGEVMVGFSESSEYVRQMQDQVELVLGTRAATGSVPTSLQLGAARVQWRAGVAVTSQLRDVFGLS